MAVTLVFKKQRAVIDTLTLDASMSESHQTEVEVTDHPVEQGANISDHRRRKPDVVTIEGFVTNTPLPSSTGAGASADPGRAENAYQTLLTLADANRLITVVTALRTYENMTITSLNVPRDAKTGQSLRFTATFRQIRIVSNKTVQLEAKTTRAKGKQDLSKKATSAASTSVKKKSFLKFAKDSDFGKQGVNFLGNVGDFFSGH